MANKFLAAIAVAIIGTLFVSCDDEVSPIGGSIAQGEVTIRVDSLFTVGGRSVATPVFDSKSRAFLLGALNMEEYGDLECSFVGQLMPSISMNIPDSITEKNVSGMKLNLQFDSKAFTGDSLAPQQLTVYRLTRQLPSDINSGFNPEGYYDKASPLGSKTFTVSALGANDSVFNKAYRVVKVDLPKAMAVETFRQYRTDPSMFTWPSEFANKFPGVYVKPTFGRGVIVNFTRADFTLYYNYKTQKSVTVDGTATLRDTLMTDSVTLFSFSPEVLASNNIQLNVSESVKQRVSAGQIVVQTPGGYNAEIDFPAQEILNRYWSADYNLAIINSLSFTLPVQEIPNVYGLTPPPYLLMIKSSKMQEFFATNSVPQGYVGAETDTDCFWATYDSDNKRYVFNALRPYIVDLMRRGDLLTEDDTKFTLVPVAINTENSGSDYDPKTMVTTCMPYLAAPTLFSLDLAKSKVRFSFSSQIIK